MNSVTFVFRKTQSDIGPLRKVTCQQPITFVPLLIDHTVSMARKLGASRFFGPAKLNTLILGCLLWNFSNSEKRPI